LYVPQADILDHNNKAGLPVVIKAPLQLSAFIDPVFKFMRGLFPKASDTDNKTNLTSLIRTVDSESQDGATSTENTPLHQTKSRDTVPLPDVTQDLFNEDLSFNSGHVDIKSPCPTLTTKDRVALIGVKAVCMNQSYGNRTNKSLDAPFNTLTTNPKGDVLSVKKIGFMVNSQYGGSTKSIEDPAATIIARQDKAPLGLAIMEIAPDSVETILTYNADLTLPAIEVLENKIIYRIFYLDDIWMQKIKKYMKQHHLIDISTRPLMITEMLQIQGFPKNYKLIGTQTEQKKYIGNSVEVCVGVALFKSIIHAINSNS
jgi:site-specific DNA-cytosine methylase